MGILKDITDSVRDLRNEISNSEAGDYLAKKRYSSIARQSMEGTLQFPVLVSRSLEVSTAQMITKALEREFSSFVQIVLSMNPYLDLKKDRDVAGYLRNFHQNTGSVKTSINDFTLENFTVLSNEEETMNAMFVTCEGSHCNKVVAENRKQLGSVYEHLRLGTVNDLHTPIDPLVSFKNGNLSAYYNNSVKPLMEARRTTTSMPIPGPNGATRQVAIDEPTAYDLRKDAVSNKQWGLSHGAKIRSQKETERQNRLTNAMNARKQDFSEMDANRRFNQSASQHADKMNFEREKFASMNRGVKLSDNDVKKSNELVPTMLNVSLNVKEDGNFGGALNFMLGIKAVLHPINNDEMVNNLVAGCKNSNKFFNFIRWTSGETTFFKDFLFNVNEIKDDVYNRSAGASHWWTTLKRRKAWAKMKHKFPIGKRVLPNTSIVVSMEEVEYIKSTYGFDLMNTKIVDKLMREYFLLSFVIVDSSLEIVHFMFDGQTDFQSVSFNGLERENNNKNDFKEVMKLVNNNRI